MRHLRATSALCCATLLLGALPAQTPEAPPIRVGLRARDGGSDRLTPLRYIGGFETKTMIYETLVRRGDDGRIAPGLASAWRVEDGGRTFRFELREGARFHDGKPVTAEAVKVHFQRWAGLPEHDWIAVNRRIVGVEVESERAFRVLLDQPYALLADLVVINPCAVVGPAARDWEGEFQRPMGTGAFRFVSSRDGGRWWRVAGVAAGEPVLDVTFFARGSDAVPIDALARGEIDAFVGGWDEDLPGARLAELENDPRFRVQYAPGSSSVYLSFRLVDGPTMDLAVRQRIAAAIDREELIAEVERGHADPSTTWAAPSLVFWPRGPGIRPVAADASAAGGAKVRLRIAAGRGEGRSTRVSRVLEDQLERAGFEVEVLAATSRPAESGSRPAAGAGTVRPLTAESGEARAAANRAVRRQAEQADLRVQVTHGAPYDPHQSLVARFGPVAAKNADDPRPRTGYDLELMALVGAAMATPEESRCEPIYARIQELMDRRALVVPLYSPHRVAVHAAGVEGIVLGNDVYFVDLTGLRRVAK